MESQEVPCVRNRLFFLWRKELCNEYLNRKDLEQRGEEFKCREVRISFLMMIRAAAKRAGLIPSHIKI